MESRLEVVVKRRVVEESRQAVVVANKLVVVESGLAVEESEPVVVEEVMEEEVRESLPELVEEDCDGSSLETDRKDHRVAVILSVFVVFEPAWLELAMVPEQAELELVMVFEPVQ